jgi:lipopolysaccharide/colanic/teichoic acid biosynthesis glycosyltransferase
VRRPVEDAAKRALDLTVATLGLVATAPGLGLIALLVRSSGPGPVIFRQERVGRYGRPFRIHKFRTLRIDASGPLVSASGDCRVTRIGAALRSTKLDELPQLWDVLRGEMSLVGPRPEVPTYAALWTAEQRETILAVRPGITDPVSILFVNEAEELALTADPDRHYRTELLPRKAQLYAEYVQTRSLTGDLVILLRTMQTLAGMSQAFGPTRRSGAMQR